MPESTSTISQNLSTRQAKFTHPTYVTLQPIWQKLRDVREGTGGFLDGSYLVAHPREWVDHTVTLDGVSTTNPTPSIPTAKFRARRKLASYENFAATLIDSIKAALSREQPVRRVGDGESEAESPLEDWWENVDGAGTHIDDFMAQCWDVAGTFGHVFLYMDRPENTDAETAADEQLPFLRAYTPLDVWDWVVDDLGELSAVKFAELAPRTSIDTAYRPDVRIRVVDREKWTLYDAKGSRVGGGEHQMGRLPVTVLYATRRSMDPNIGASVLGDPNLFIDLYNLKSEVRELLRNQTFSILNVPLGNGEGAMTVTEAQTMMGASTGTQNVLFSGTAAAYIQPESTNVEVYHQEMARALRVIYRLASLSWESDSKDAEALGSLQLKREDMNIRLARYADEMERTEYALADLFYRATKGAEAGPQALKNDDVTIAYPDTFDMTPFDQVLEQADAAAGLGMPAVFMKEMRKHLARKFDGIADLPPATLGEIDKAIDDAPDDITPQEQAKQRMDGMAAALKAGPQAAVVAPNFQKVPAA